MSFSRPPLSSGSVVWKTPLPKVLRRPRPSRVRSRAARRSRSPRRWPSRRRRARRPAATARSGRPSRRDLCSGDARPRVETTSRPFGRKRLATSWRLGELAAGVAAQVEHDPFAALASACGPRAPAGVARRSRTRQRRVTPIACRRGERTGPVASGMSSCLRSSSRCAWPLPEAVEGERHRRARRAAHARGGDVGGAPPGSTCRSRPRSRRRG